MDGVMEGEAAGDLKSQRQPDEEFAREVDVHMAAEERHDDIHHQIRNYRPLHPIKFGEQRVIVQVGENIHPRQMIDVIFQRRYLHRENRSHSGDHQSRQHRNQQPRRRHRRRQGFAPHHARFHEPIPRVRTRQARHRPLPGGLPPHAAAKRPARTMTVMLTGTRVMEMGENRWFD